MKEAHGISIYERIMPRDAPSFPLNFSAKLLLKVLFDEYVKTKNKQNI